jgi:hypothetical protein
MGWLYVPLIYRRYLAGESLSELAVWLTSLNLRTWKRDSKDGNHKAGDPMPWWPATVMELIRNPVYIGHYAKDDGAWMHDCEPLIDATTFRLANEALTDRQRKQRGPRGNPENYAMLRGAVRCPRCGCGMVKIVSKGRWVQAAAMTDEIMSTGAWVRHTSKRGGNGWYELEPFYRCAGQGPQAKGCGNHVPMHPVDEAVNKIMAARFRVPLMMWTLVRGVDHQP